MGEVGFRMHGWSSDVQIFLFLQVKFIWGQSDRIGVYKGAADASLMKFLPGGMRK